MTHQITHKLAAVVFAILVNGVMLGSVSYLFTPPATAMSQPRQGEPIASIYARALA